MASSEPLVAAEHDSRLEAATMLTVQAQQHPDDYHSMDSSQLSDTSQQSPANLPSYRLFPSDCAILKENRHLPSSSASDGAEFCPSQATNAAGLADELGDNSDLPDDPRKWPLFHRILTVFALSLNTAVVIGYSTSYSLALRTYRDETGLEEDFNVSHQIGLLGMTTYHLGMGVGSLIFAPFSEFYGRRPCYIITSSLFTILFVPYALARNIETILTFRFLAGLAGSAVVAVAPGSIADITDQTNRPLWLTLWNLGPMISLAAGPLLGGLAFQEQGWRWSTWSFGIMALVSGLMVSFIPETYRSILIERIPKPPSESYFDRADLRTHHSKSRTEPSRLLALGRSLSRPFIFIFTEPILIFWDLYLSLVYGVVYMCFVAYPIVFSDRRGWSPLATGLSFIGIASGVLMASALEPAIRRWIATLKRDPYSDKAEPESLVAPLCVATILVSLGEIIFAWTCLPPVPWVVPILAGIPFGLGACLVFVYVNSYILHSYGKYGASAVAGNMALRSVAGAVLPLAASILYRDLGPRAAGSLMAGLEAMFIPLPFVFWRYGAAIRAKSSLIQSLQEDRP